MKTHIFIIVSVALLSLKASGQEWIGNLFSLDTVVVFQSGHTPQNLNLILCLMEGNTFYFAERQGFQDKNNGYQAVIHALSTEDYEQTDILLPLPDNGQSRDRHARGLWIYDFCFNGDHLLLTTQDELILYKRIHSQTFRVERTYRHHNLFMGFLHQNRINYFEEDHDKGFKWFQQDLEGGPATLIRELPYEAPHIVQIQPNRYISHNQQSVFFLSTRYPRLEVYDLDGTLRDTILFDLPQWKVFEDEYIQKTLNVPYGIERIYAVKDDLNAYSYPKVAMPMDGDFLLFYMQYDSTKGKSELQYAIRTEDGPTIRLLRNNHEDSVYHATRFPFTLFQGGFDKGNASDNGILVQLSYKTDVTWKGKTQQKYIEDLNQYFSTNTPVLAYKIMRYQPPETGRNPTLFTPSGASMRLDELPGERNVLLLHNGLECSGCVKALYQLINQSQMEHIHIGQVYSHVINGLQAFEISNQIRVQLNKPFALYYDTSAYHGTLSHPAKLQDSDFPCLILHQKGAKPKLFRLSELFTPNYGVTEFREEFLEAWHSYLKQQ
jgi:hypothetical protein